jgi:cytochrome P450 family 4
MGINLSDLGEKGKLYKNNIREIGSYCLELLLKPWLKFEFVKNYIGFEEKLLNALKPAHEFTRDIFHQRSKNYKITENDDDDKSENIYFKKKRRYAMMDTLLNAQAENLIDEEGILEETDTFTFEGHDTTSAAVTFTLLLLSHHSDIQEKLLDEINQTISSTGRSEFMIDDFNKLELMERVIKESLRLYPPVHFISRVLSEDINLKGEIFPKGRLVNVHIFDIHRDPSIYPDPEKFDPDRFLPENCAERNHFAFVAFSAGMRNCIGQKFAMLELKMLLMKIITNFKILPVTERDEIVFFADLILRTKNPVEMKFLPRK